MLRKQGSIPEELSSEKKLFWVQLGSVQLLFMKISDRLCALALAFPDIFCAAHMFRLCAVSFVSIPVQQFALSRESASFS